ncbi:hypothetical protein AOLI_G00246340 [Acnodon oligacanthus]
MAEVVELHKLKLAELKQECALRGLDVKGNKGDLIARLQQYLEEHEEDANEEEEVLEEYPEEPSPKAEEPVQEQSVAEPVTEPKKNVVKITLESSVDERLQKRAERFNLSPGADNKKAARAARFGLPETSTASSKGASAVSKSNVDVDILKKRAERFGMNVSSVAKKVEEDEKLKKRKERFGILTSAASAGADDAEDSTHQDLHDEMHEKILEQANGEQEDSSCLLSCSVISAAGTSLHKCAEALVRRVEVAWCKSFGSSRLQYIFC